MVIELIGIAATLLIRLGLTLIIFSDVLMGNGNDLSFKSYYRNFNTNLISSIHEFYFIKENMIYSNFGNQFNLKLNQSAIINSGEIKVTFLEVTEDSRCSSDLNCFSAGQIQVSVNILENGHDLGTLHLVNNASHKDLSIKKINKYLIEFIKAEPYPKSNQKIEFFDYIITLAISLAKDD
jgi:hypothetical protein